MLIIAKFVRREYTEQVLGVENRLEKSERCKDAYMTEDYARKIQEERTSLIKAMFAAREKGCDAKVTNRNLFIDNQAYDIHSVPREYRPVCWAIRTIQGMCFSLFRRTAQKCS